MLCWVVGWCGGACGGRRSTCVSVQLESGSRDVGGWEGGREGERGGEGQRQEEGKQTDLGIQLAPHKYMKSERERGS